MTATDEDLKRLSEIVKASDVALLTTVSEDGDLHSRPLAVQDRDFDGTLWFFTMEPSEKTRDVARNDRVNVALSSKKGYLSLAGRATVVRNSAKIDELWDTSVEAWFPEGRDDPSLALLRVDADSAEYWSLDDPKPVMLVKMAAAAVRGGTPDVGTNEAVDL